MPSSSLSHAGGSQNDAQVGSDSNHSPTMMMAQPSAHTPNPAPGAYALHGQHAYAVPTGPEPYPHHVMPYVPGPHQAQQNPNLLYSVESPQIEQAVPPTHQPQENEYEDAEGTPPPSISAPTGNGNGKRKHSDSATPNTSGKRRRQRAPAEGEDGEEGEVGPNGGAKHWTVEEKTRLFTWMLNNDEHWEAFRTRMNTVFRECSAELFPGRKSYTALKSCYHRNLDVFKQVHAFQVFSALHIRHLRAENPNAAQPGIDTLLEAARVAGLSVGSLNVKVIDRWYETGWFDLFKTRYREDPKTGLPTPYYGPPEQSTIMAIHDPIDPQLVNSNPLPSSSSNYSAPPVPTTPLSATAPVSNGLLPYSPAPNDHHPTSSSASQSSVPPVQQAFSYIRSSNALPPKILHGSSTASSTPRNADDHTRNVHDSEHGRNQATYRAEVPSAGQHPPDNPSQTAQALAQLTDVTKALLDMCSSLKELIQQQTQESQVRMEHMRGGVNASAVTTGGEKTREKEISVEKVTFATEILKNGPQNDDIKKAAIECLTKYLTRDL